MKIHGIDKRRVKKILRLWFSKKGYHIKNFSCVIYILDRKGTYIAWKLDKTYSRTYYINDKFYDIFETSYKENKQYFLTFMRKSKIKY